MIIRTSASALCESSKTDVSRADASLSDALRASGSVAGKRSRLLLKIPTDRS